HHERLDGMGYPFGIYSGLIDPFSRIVAVADVFHAMASWRVYSDPLPFYEVMNQIERQSFGMLEPSIVRLLIEKIMQNATGYNAILTNGLMGRIVHVHPQNPTRPIVQIKDRFIDLYQTLELNIEQVIFTKAY